MLTTILVPTDFSAHSAMALEHAIELARRFSGTIHLLHAYSIVIPALYPEPIRLPPTVIEDLRESARNQLESQAKRLAGLGIPHQAHVIPGSPATVIVELASSLPADLIVLGTRGLTGLKHVVLGSVAERVVRLAHCPVMTVKAEGA
jgi:universal stress protein A